MSSSNVASDSEDEVLDAEQSGGEDEVVTRLTTVSGTSFLSGSGSAPSSATKRSSAGMNKLFPPVEGEIFLVKCLGCLTSAVGLKKASGYKVSI